MPVAVDEGWFVMTVPVAGTPEGALGLADFLAELRAELNRARDQAVADGSGLRLGVDQVELSLDVGYTLEKSGGTQVKASAKFWVFASAEAGASGSVSSQRVHTQHLKLLLTPRVETVTVDESGHTTTKTGGLDVHGQLEPSEEHVELPAPPPPPTG
jgi:hypothetical protein